jgi:hypothetical protein
MLVLTSLTHCVVRYVCLPYEHNSKEYASVALKTRQLLMRQQLPSPQQRRIAISTILTAVAPTASDSTERLARLGPLIDQAQPIEDLIFSFLFDTKHSTAIQVWYLVMCVYFCVCSLSCICARVDCGTGSVHPSHVPDVHHPSVVRRLSAQTERFGVQILVLYG